jgi:L-histidine Nalpha-methyltransferase / hercynylcysteine S-oxide synthase
MNGLKHVDQILGGGTGLANLHDFEYVSIYNEVLGRHEAYYRALSDVTLTIPTKSSGDGGLKSFTSIHLERDELINVEYSVKYSAEEVHMLCIGSGFVSPMVSFVYD